MNTVKEFRQFQDIIAKYIKALQRVEMRMDRISNDAEILTAREDADLASLVGPDDHLEINDLYEAIADQPLSGIARCLSYNDDDVDE